MKNSNNFFIKVSQLLNYNTSINKDSIKIDRGTGSFESACLANAAINGYYVYEAGLFQVFFYFVVLNFIVYFNYFKLKYLFL